MTAQDYFDCKKHNCRLTVEACMARRTAFKEHRNRLIPEYPECQECSQYYTVQKNKTQRGEKIMYPKKIDDDRLRTMVAEGKYTKDIASAFGVGKGAVAARMKTLGLTPNYERQRKSAPAPRQKRDTVQPIAPVNAAHPVDKVTPGQIIPVTLRLTVEVNVRVSAERV